MSQHRTQLLFEIRDCLDHLHIPTQILDVEITEVINQYLSPFWRGSSSKIDWQLISNNVQKTDFPYHISIDAQLTQQLLYQTNFRVLQQKTPIILYFSGLSPCLLLHNCELPNIIFHIMDEFCYLDTFLIFAAQPILEQQKITDFLEIQFFDYFCGQI